MEKEQTTLRLPKRLKERLTIEAKEKGTNFNQLVMIILGEYLNHQK